MMFLSFLEFVDFGSAGYRVGIFSLHLRNIRCLLFLFFVKGVSGIPSFLKSLVTVRKLYMIFARIVNARPSK